ncbi:hypothetical protein RhiirA1_495495 [Rhizophagus irregularis]|uniref:Uncharacterized protein n=1 Tax=Rhizophagus irregularis TaxID=588596 RepID=A0A2N0R5D8_9GLOM|nr:hypothetical protein RhiirA1_495495 [Rhizophagus irregularis]
MANNNPETLAQFYGLFLYKKKDIIAIQEKLGIGPGNANELVVPPDSELMGKTLADSYELLLELVGDLIPIQEKLNIDGNPILEEALRSNKASTDIPFGEIFNLFMCLEEDIIAIQDKLDIVGYSNQERAEEVDENMRACLRKLKEFHGPLEDDPVPLVRASLTHLRAFQSGSKALSSEACSLNCSGVDLADKLYLSKNCSRIKTNLLVFTFWAFWMGSAVDMSI